MNRKWTSALCGTCLFVAASAWGATAVEPTLKLTAEERYDDDALLRVRGDGQLMTKLSPELGVSVKRRTTETEGAYAPDFVMRHGSGTFTVDHRGRASGSHSVSERVGVEADARVWRVSDPTSLPRTGMARSLSPMLYGRLQLGSSVRTTERFTLRGYYRFEGAQVLESGRSPGVVHAPSLEGWYRATRRLEVGTEYRYQAFRFGGEAADAHGGFGLARYRITRLTTFTARGGPIYFRGRAVEQQGFMPRIALELAREGEGFDLALAAGHDLVGASGFTSALWADYASVMTSLRIFSRSRLYGVASYFRNGRPPNADLLAMSHGYAVGAGVEVPIWRRATLQLGVDRIAQLGAEGETDLALSRNVAALRLTWNAW